ncbi:hypothetical protein P7C71_g5541, partial [Lecanoromycetidae sp. Uapishka_2]
MISRALIARNGQRALQWHIRSGDKRCMAAAASGSFSYETGDAAGIKVASRDIPGPTTHLAVVAKAGTRYEPLPGFSEGLEKFSFKVTPIMDMSRKELLGKTSQFAINSAHAVAFHRGLGNPLYPSSSTPMSKYLDEGRLQTYSQVAYAKPNFAIVANGANQQELLKWVSEFFTEVQDSPPEGFPVLGADPTKYYGGEERIAHASGNTMVIAFPGSGSVTGGSYKPESQVLTALLGGESNIKWAPGFSLLSKATEAYPGVHISTTHHTYSDAGLITISISGNAQQLRGASQDVVKTLKKVAAGDVSKEDVTKAIATAKFKALESGQNIDTGIELTGAGLVQGGKAFQLDELAKAIDSVTVDGVKKAAKQLLEGKATVSSVGDLYILPFAEEIGLNV